MTCSREGCEREAEWIPGLVVSPNPKRPGLSALRFDMLEQAVCTECRPTFEADQKPRNAMLDYIERKVSDVAPDREAAFYVWKPLSIQ